MLIGLVGATGAGKTTLANLLFEREGYVRAHMGQPIKDMLSAFGLSHDELTGSPDCGNGHHPCYVENLRVTPWKPSARTGADGWFRRIYG